MPPEYFVTRKKMPPRKKILLLLVKMLYFKYLQSKLQCTTPQSITTLQVHITTSEAFSFFHLSLIVANACQKFTVCWPFCLAVKRYLSFSFKVLLVLLTFWLAAHPWLPLLQLSCFSFIIFLPQLVCPTTISSLQMGLPIL